MISDSSLVHRLRNTSVRNLIKALQKDGFILERQTKTGSDIYAHSDGRLTVIHYHAGSDTLTRKTLKSVLDATRWTEADCQHLGLLK